MVTVIATADHVPTGSKSLYNALFFTAVVLFGRRRREILIAAVTAS